jgi:hypothetical protein
MTIAIAGNAYLVLILIPPQPVAFIGSIAAGGRANAVRYQFQMDYRDER